MTWLVPNNNIHKEFRFVPAKNNLVEPLVLLFEPPFPWSRMNERYQKFILGWNFIVIDWNGIQESFPIMKLEIFFTSVCIMLVKFLCIVRSKSDGSSVLDFKLKTFLIILTWLQKNQSEFQSVLIIMRHVKSTVLFIKLSFWKNSANKILMKWTMRILKLVNILNRL